ncbi:MAG: hypothetical protein HS124_00990 [Anaerolineales bacterium]|nr:hypothetical protein [Anaerolineales bacterium]
MTQPKNLKRVQFKKDATAKEIWQYIRRSQDNWAKKFPDRAHSLYPTIYDENGNRILSPTQKAE